jgi:hypothetical protein
MISNISPLFFQRKYRFEIPVKVPIPPILNRHIHKRIEVPSIILDPEVSKLKFKEISKLLKDSEKVYKKSWSIREIIYPYIMLNIFNKTKKIICILLFNFTNFDYLPPRVTLLDLNLKLHKPLKEESIIPDLNGKKHVYYDKGVWFCLPGTSSYHGKYNPIDPWEIIRHDWNILDFIQQIKHMLNIDLDVL